MLESDREVRMRFTLTVLPAAAALLFCGCRPFHETEANHILHSGETGILAHPVRPKVCAAISKDDIHALARAEDSGDESAVAQFVENGKAIEIPVNTKVRVVSESYNERKLELLEGPYKGRTVWVPMEWLKAHETPRPPYSPIS
jgi:hypothetical protein